MIEAYEDPNDPDNDFIDPDDDPDNPAFFTGEGTSYFSGDKMLVWTEDSGGQPIDDWVEQDQPSGT